MRIQSGTLSMESTRTEVERTTYNRDYSKKSGEVTVAGLSKADFGCSLADQLRKMQTTEDEEGTPTTNYGRNGSFLGDSEVKSSKKTDATSVLDGLDPDSARYQFTLLALLLRRIFMDRFGGNTSSQPYDLLSQYESCSEGTYSGKAIQTHESLTESYSYYESESTSVAIAGQVNTSDGKSIDFNVNLNMSREFSEQYCSTTSNTYYMLMDPIVINLDVNSAAVSDLDFTFDLDMDGTEDQIATLQKGSGFLAWDRNGDGTINDGSELFGARTGDGFRELSELDSDGDGWIDEDDEAFNDLKVWIRDSQGNNRLMTLKEADVGAICVNAIDSEFSIKNESQEIRGRIGQTGVYLHESTGMAGTVQHVDLAVRSA